jgi:Tol biopolymer transport system component
MSLASGTRIGPYEITGTLGAGGMGEVYRARDTRLGRDVAMKVLPAGFASDPDRLQRFEQEARAAAALNHPNILAVYDIGHHDGAPFIVSELLDGENLRDHLRGGAVPVRKAVEYGVQVAQGLAAAHDKGIVHRDLKPENIFVTHDGRVKILDFSLAKLTQAEAAGAGLSALPTTPPRTQDGVILGTVGYMSPEQVRGDRADHRADIFAFGAVLYEMLGGRQAFHRETGIETMAAILREDPPELPIAQRQIPPALDRLVRKCLEKTPAARLQSASDLAFALEGLSSHSDRTEVRGALAVDVRRWSRARLVWAVMTAVLVATMGWLGAAMYLRTPPANPDVVRATIDLPSGGYVFSVDHFLAISPDGRRVAFAAQGPDGRRQLWLRPFNGVAAQPLAGTEGATDPFWSPDSRFIAFFAGGKLKKMDAAGGPVSVLCDAANAAGGTWNRDDVIVFSDFSTLYRVAASGGTPVLIAGPGPGDPDSLYQFPFFLPDGDHFVHRGRGLQTYVRSLSTNEVKPLGGGGNAQYAQEHLVFWRDGALVAQALDTSRLDLTGEVVRIAEDVRGAATGAAFSISDTGVLVYQQAGSGAESQLTWFDRAGRPIGELGEPGDYGDLELSPDGARLAVSVLDPARRTRDVWLFDVRRGLRNAFTFDPANEVAVMWSPDGNRVVFDSNRGGNFDLYEKPSNGAAEETLFFSGEGAERAFSWSPDGRYILFQTATDLFALPLTGERKPVPLVTTSFTTSRARFSPDGRWLAYTSYETGRDEVWVAPFPGPGGKWLVSTGGGSWSRWRRDGKEIFYVDPANRLMAAEVNGEGAAFEVQNVRPLFETRARTGPRYMYDVSADGQRFLINSLPEQPATPPLTLVINWPALLQ